MPEEFLRLSAGAAEASFYDPVMKLGFIILRNTYYKFMGPVIDAALKRGWDVVCWHFESDHYHRGSKAYQRPSIGPRPVYAHGNPPIINFYSYDELNELVRSVDCVVSLHGRSMFDGCRAGTPWVIIQHNADTINDGQESLLSADSICFYTKFWIDFACEYLDAQAEGTSPRPSEDIRRKALATGYVEPDAFQKINPDEVRKKWHIPAERPVITYMPNAHARLRTTPFSDYVMNNMAVLRRIKGFIRFPHLIKYLPYVVRGWNDRAMVRAVRQFCDFNNGFLIIKTREKTKLTDYEKQAADLVLYDETYSPGTFLEVVAISSLLISGKGFSSCVTGSLYAGVPYLLADFGRDSWNNPWKALMESRAEPTYWRCKNAIFRMGVPHLIRKLPRMRLEDFRVDPASRDSYLKTIVGPDDGHNADRVLDAIGQLLQQKAAAPQGVCDL